MNLQNYHDWIAERQRLLERIKELEAENAELKKRLGKDIVTVVQEPTAMQKLSVQEKVELFRNLFKGREDAIKNLLVFEVHSFSEQSDRIDKIEKLASTGTISLVIIDSLTMFYRLNHEDSYVRNDFIRQTEVLLNMAREYEIAIMLTSQVYSNINTGGVEFLGGHALHHNAKTIIRLDKRTEGRRAAVIMKHRSLPEGRAALYRITETGISDT